MPSISIDRVAERFKLIREQFQQHLRDECQKLWTDLEFRHQMQVNEKCGQLQLNLVATQQEMSQMLLKNAELKNKFEKLQNNIKRMNAENFRRLQMSQEGTTDHFSIKREAKRARMDSRSNAETLSDEIKLPMERLLPPTETSLSPAMASASALDPTEVDEGSSIALVSGAAMTIEPNASDVIVAAATEQEPTDMSENTATATISQPNAIDRSNSIAPRTIISAEGKVYLCTERNCNKKFCSKRSLRIHQSAHSSEKPFVCIEPNCGKRFTTKLNLKCHKRIHSGERPFACSEPGCKATFMNREQMKDHMGKHRGDGPYNCTLLGCDKSFSTNTNLKRHMLSHTGERLFICFETNCGKAFQRSDHLKKHMLTHARVRRLTRPGEDASI